MRGQVEPRKRQRGQRSAQQCAPPPAEPVEQDPRGEGADPAEPTPTPKTESMVAVPSPRPRRPISDTWVVHETKTRNPRSPKKSATASTTTARLASACLYETPGSRPFDLL